VAVWVTGRRIVDAAASRDSPGARMYAAINSVKNDFFIGMVSENETFRVALVAAIRLT
jgi:hypothetical protein